MAENDLTTSYKKIKATNGDIVHSPLVGVARRPKTDYVRYAAEFGLTPASRNPVDGHGGNSSDPANRFFT